LAEWLDQIEREFERLGELPLDGQELVALSEEFAVSNFWSHDLKLKNSPSFSKNDQFS
jgi:hypothetical protein